MRLQAALLRGDGALRHAFRCLLVKELRGLCGASARAETGDAYRIFVVAPAYAEDVPNTDRPSGFGALGIDEYLPAIDCCDRQRTRLEKARRPQPLVQTNRLVAAITDRRLVDISGHDDIAVGRAGARKPARLMTRQPTGSESEDRDFCIVEFQGQHLVVVESAAAGRGGTQCFFVGYD